MCKKIYSLVIAIAIMTGCGSTFASSYKPKLNTKPKHFLTIKGHIDKSLLGKISLKIEQVTSTAKCFYNTNVLAGSESSYSIKDRYRARANKNGNYEIRIPINRYEKGKCHWKPYLTSWDVTYKSSGKKNYGPLAVYSYKSNQEKQTVKGTIYCSPLKGSCVYKASKGSDAYMVINSNLNARVAILNIKDNK